MSMRTHVQPDDAPPPTPPPNLHHTQTPALQQLNMYGCRRASGRQLQVLVDRLPLLTWLSVNGCHGIQALHLIRECDIGSSYVTVI